MSNSNCLWRCWLSVFSLSFDTAIPYTQWNHAVVKKTDGYICQKINLQGNTTCEANATAMSDELKYLDYFSLFVGRRYILSIYSTIITQHLHICPSKEPFGPSPPK